MAKPIFLNTPAIDAGPSEAFANPLYGNATWHTLLSAPQTATDTFSAGIATCPACGTLALHRHTQAEIYFIVDGTGEVEVDGVRHKVSKGVALWIPGNAEHGVFCGPGEELKWFYVFPGDSFDEVVYRFSQDERKIPAKL